MTVKITLACTECKQRNYNTTKNKKNNPAKEVLSLYHVFFHSSSGNPAFFLVFCFFFLPACLCGGACIPDINII